MKRNLSLCLGLLAFAFLPALAQTPGLAGPTGKVHGHVTNPTGAPQSGGTVSFVAVDRAASGPGLSAKTSEKGVFQVDASGDYSGEVPVGTYAVIYRSPGMSAEKQADKFENVKVVAGQTTLQDIDMSRKEYIDAMSPEQKKQLEDLKKKNSEVMKANEVVKAIMADVKIANQDLHDADTAHVTAVQALGATASRADVEAKEAEIKTAKYTEIETLMKKDTELRPGESSLWAQLGQAQVGLKEYDQAEVTFKKVLDLEAAAKKPSPSTQGAADTGLGEIYARTGKIPEANAAYDAAAKANPAGAGSYLKNEAVIFFQLNNGDAQLAAAEEAIKADPTLPLIYYLKGQALIQKATIDPATGKMILPAGCAEAYQKYLQLDPNGPYAGEVKAILDEAGQTHSSVYATPKPSKKK